MNINTFIIRFENKISQKEIPFFRGAIINAAGKDDILFHNHLQDSFRYSYPLIQYKRINGKAAIVCIGEGSDSIGLFLSNKNYDFNIGERKTTLNVENTYVNTTVIRNWDCMFSYSLRKFLPLNQKNYKLYHETESVIEKYKIIERSLIGNILSFTKGIGIHIEDEIKLEITQMSEPHVYYFKNIKMLGFDLQFNSSVSLPEYIGLGKNVSVGFGLLTRIKKNNK